MSERRNGPVLIAGSTGFIGGHLREHLTARGHETRWGTRRPDHAEGRWGKGPWVRCNLAEEDTLKRSLEGCESAVFLVHGMGEGGDYARREQEGAERFVRVAEQQGVRRIVYLGGPFPKDCCSEHLKSRAMTGEILRSGAADGIELRAAMIVGPGSASWLIVRDLALRLPVMVLPKWLASKSCPIAVWDVVQALGHAVESEEVENGWYELPGPEALTAEEIIRQVAEIRSSRPRMFRSPALTPRLSSVWIQLFTRAPPTIAKQLVSGLVTDLLPEGPVYWDYLPDHETMTFQHAASRTLELECPPSSNTAQWWERAVGRLTSRRGNKG